MRGKRDGAILVEAVAAMALVMVATFPLIEAVSAVVRQQRREADSQKAMVYAVRLMEARQALAYADVASAAEAPIAGDTRFTQEVAVSVVETDLKQITVTLRWNSGNDSYSLVSLKAG